MTGYHLSAPKVFAGKALLTSRWTLRPDFVLVRERRGKKTEYKLSSISEIRLQHIKTNRQTVRKVEFRSGGKWFDVNGSQPAKVVAINDEVAVDFKTFVEDLHSSLALQSQPIKYVWGSNLIYTMSCVGVGLLGVGACVVIYKIATDGSIGWGGLAKLLIGVPLFYAGLKLGRAKPYLPTEIPPRFFE